MAPNAICRWYHPQLRLRHGVPLDHVTVNDLLRPSEHFEVKPIMGGSITFLTEARMERDQSHFLRRRVWRGVWGWGANQRAGSGGMYYFCPARPRDSSFLNVFNKGNAGNQFVGQIPKRRAVWQEGRIDHGPPTLNRSRPCRCHGHRARNSLGMKYQTFYRRT